MSYKEEIEIQRQEAQNHQTANKILSLMKSLRTDLSDSSERRWIWELIQNAKDVSYDNSNVEIELNIQINETTGKVEFSHNGKPFTVKDITYLIQQESSKERMHKENERLSATGKFGTGFLTTHLLSEIVTVESVVIKENLQPKRFSLTLDRSGRDIEPIIQSVNLSFDQLNNLDSLNDYSEFQEGKLNTTFSYHLNEKGIKVARLGLSDFHTSIQYVLSFIQNIKRVYIKSENATYTRSELTPLVERVNLSTVIKQTDGDNTEIYQIVLLSDKEGLVTIAVPIYKDGNTITILDVRKEIPKLFCDFPLIGTNEFKFPTIVNSPFFNPNDQSRSGVILAEKDETDIIENTKLFLKAVELYFELIDIASRNNWVNIYKLAKIKYKNFNWLSENWYKQKVLLPLQNKLLKIPIVDTSRGNRVAILNNDNTRNIYFPSSNLEIVREKIWKLASVWIPKNLPQKEHIHDWCEIIWKDCPELTLELITISIQAKNDLEGIKTMINASTSPIDWLNDYYDILNLEGKFIDEIIKDKYAVIPNQNGKFRKTKDLRIDQNIDDELKNILLLLGQPIKDILKGKDIKTKSQYNEENVGKIRYESKTQEQVATDISKLIKPILRVPEDRVRYKEAIRKLYLWMNKNGAVAAEMFGDLYEKKFLLVNDEEIATHIEMAESFESIAKSQGKSAKEILELLESGKMKLVSEDNFLVASQNGISNETSITINEGEIPKLPSDIKSHPGIKVVSGIADDAKRIVKDKLESEFGYVLPDIDSMKYTIIKNAINAEKKNITIVIKSANGGKIYFYPSEWIEFCEDGAQLFVVTSGNKVLNVTINELLLSNEEFFMRFNSNKFIVETNLTHFANFFQYLSETYFVFNSPENSADFLQEFGLNQRNLSASDLSADDKNLLH